MTSASFRRCMGCENSADRAMRPMTWKSVRGFLANITVRHRLTQLLTMVAVIAGLVGMHQLSTHHQLVTGSTVRPTVSDHHHTPSSPHLRSITGSAWTVAAEHNFFEHGGVAAVQVGDNDECVGCHTGYAATCLLMLAMVMVALSHYRRRPRRPIRRRSADRRLVPTSGCRFLRPALTLSELSILRT